MAEEDIKRDFPSLTLANFQVISDEDFNYNCLAFVLGDPSNWWEPPNGFGRYWPAGFGEDVTVETVTAILRKHGFSVEAGRGVTPETEAVAIFAEGQEWTHFAKFSNGRWTSKLGEGNDIAHARLEDLEGALYGSVVKVLRRPDRD